MRYFFDPPASKVLFLIILSADDEIFAIVGRTVVLASEPLGPGRPRTALRQALILGLSDAEAARIFNIKEDSVRRLRKKAVEVKWLEYFYSPARSFSFFSLLCGSSDDLGLPTRSAEPA